MFQSISSKQNLPYIFSLQGGHANESPEADAAVCIQRWFRGFRGRKIYAEKLFERFEKV